MSEIRWHWDYSMIVDSVCMEILNNSIENVYSQDCGFSIYFQNFTHLNLLHSYSVSFRKVVLEEGVFDQIRVDHGKEFVLTLYGQECLADFRGNAARDPHRQTESKKVVCPLSWNNTSHIINRPINANF